MHRVEEDRVAAMVRYRTELRDLVVFALRKQEMAKERDTDEHFRRPYPLGPPGNRLPVVFSDLYGPENSVHQVSRRLLHATCNWPRSLRHCFLLDRNSV